MRPFLVNLETKLCLRESDIKPGGDPDVYVVWDEKTNSAKAWPFPGDPDVEPALFGSYKVNGIECKPGYQLLKERVDEWTFEKAAEICWLDPVKAREAALLYASYKPSGLVLGVATDQIVNAAQAPMATAILDFILGNVEKPGALLQRFKGGPVMDMVFPLGQLLPPEQFKKRLGLIEHKGLLQWSAGHIPSHFDAVLTGQPYKPRVWLERSGNKLATLGNASQAYEVLKEMDFVVHMYMYPTSFSAMADILLPAAEWLETNLPVTSINKVFARQAVVHLWETMDETMYWSKLAKRLAELGHEGCQKAFDPQAAAPQPYWDSMDQLLDSWVAGLGMTWDEFKEKVPITFATPEEYRQYYVYLEKDEKTGLPRGFGTRSKKLEVYMESLLMLGRTGAPFSPIPLEPASVDYDPLPYYIEPAESPLSTPDLAKEFPYTLTSGRLPYYHHGTLRNIPWLRELYPAPQVQVNPVDAADLGIKDGDWVWVESQRGKTRAVTHVTAGIPPKVVYMERFWYPELPEKDPSLYGWRESNVNILTKNDPPYNPEFGTYTLRGFLVKIYKADGAPEGVWLKPEEFKPWLPSPEGGA
jgi:anaerobic selenocysteine-containing dehydrogenase